MVEWDATAIVLSASPIGDIDAIATVLTADRGLQRGFVKAARARKSRRDWEPGNRLSLHHRSRLEDQLGTFTAEPLHLPHAGLVDRPIALAALISACATAAAALLPMSPAPRAFDAIDALLAPGLSDTRAVWAVVVFEFTLLEELGYGLDLSPEPGEVAPLAYVSPRTGRAVTAERAGAWRDRLFHLPAFLLDIERPTDPSFGDLLDALSITGHFLLREVFADDARRVPAARSRLVGLLERASREPFE